MTTTTTGVIGIIWIVAIGVFWVVTVLGSTGDQR